MKHKNLTRDEKIKFLNDFKNGKATVNSIIPIHVDFWKKSETGYTNMRTDEFLKHKEFEILCKMTIERNGYLVVLDAADGKPMERFGKLDPSAKLDDDSYYFLLDWCNNQM